MKKNSFFSLVLVFSIIFSILFMNTGASAMELDDKDSSLAINLDDEIEATKQQESNYIKPSKPLNRTLFKASSKTDVNLTEAYQYMNKVGEEVEVFTIKISQADRGKTYDILIDSETNEYTVIESDAIDIVDQDKNIEATNTNYFIGATYTTNDPFVVPLNRSTHEMTWGGDSNDAWKISRYASAWAANPSSLGTHWYVIDNKYEGYVDGGKYINTSSYHSYYNMDFGFNDQRTDVWHRLNIRGENDGYASITVEKGKSGEGSSLLNFVLQTY